MAIRCGKLHRRLHRQPRQDDVLVRDSRRPNQEASSPAPAAATPHATYRAGARPVRLHLPARPHRHAHASHRSARGHGRSHRVFLASPRGDLATVEGKRRRHVVGRLHQRTQCRHLRARRPTPHCAITINAGKVARPAHAGERAVPHDSSWRWRPLHPGLQGTRRQRALSRRRRARTRTDSASAPSSSSTTARTCSR